MNSLEIFINERKTNFAPGENITGEVSWQLEKSVKALEVRLLWFTEGKGTSDISVEQTQRIEAPVLSGRQKYNFILPLAPYSFAGQLIELLWTLELVTIPGQDAARADFVLAPGGRAINLKTDDDHSDTSKIPAWVQEELNPKKPSSIQSENPFETSTSHRL